ncbi:MAG TPA: alkaline phosphatase PhoX [Longimicrobiaceae bacterium]|nr:alkaline phosphatase PhoX [Longimicrobiaceae bacterium]
MSQVTRRDFLRNVAVYGGGAVFAPSLAGLAACNDATTAVGAAAVQRAAKGFGGYGPLAVSARCPELLVPEGFTVARLSQVTRASQADPSFTVPQALDGMAAFPLPNGNVRLIRNHEIRDSAAGALAIGPNAYDAKAGGGTSSLEVRVSGSGAERRVELLAEYVSLSGTHVNCAGGPTPWGSWLSCEETTEGEAQGRLRDHGYVFEVPASATGPVDPLPLKAMGRFVHEAVAIDPVTGFVYETEDMAFDPASGRAGSGFYRFIPTVPGNLAAGGRLQVLAVKGKAQYNTITGQRPGVILPVEWVDVDDADPAAAETNPSAVFQQGWNRGAAVFQRLEGCWYGDGSIFFNATSGGDAGAGQVWQYRPLGSAQAQLAGSGGQLILVFESPSPEVMDSPDNICVSPRGGLVVCEDGAGVQFIRGLTRRGEVFDFVQTNGDMAEFCGACFSPDGEVLFFNIQGSTSREGTGFGATYAIWGPWEEGAL